VLTSFADSLHHFRGPLAYTVVGLLVFGEAAVLLGFVIPGEIAALIGGAVAGLHHADVVIMVAVVVGAAVAGDSVGFEVGKYLGPWLLAHRPLRGRAGVGRGQQLVVRFGGPAVFFGRFVALARALVPGITGMSGMRYRTFIFYNVLGGAVWGTTFVLLGFALGASYEKAAKVAGQLSLVLVIIIVVTGSWLVIRRRRRQRIEPG